MGFIFLSIIFGIVQISVWNCFPKWFLRIMFGVPILAIIANGAASFLIMKVAGTSGLIGSANLGGSVIFAIWVLIMKGE